MAVLSITYPNFVPFTIIQSSQVNQNNADIVNFINGGNMDDMNLATGGVGNDSIANQAVTSEKLDSSIFGGTTPAPGVTLMPVGAVVPLGIPTVPTGWLLCDGSPVSQATYADLWAAMGTSHIFGPDPGGGNFLLPAVNRRIMLGTGVGLPLGSGDAIPEGSRTVDHAHGPGTYTKPAQGALNTFGNTAFEGTPPVVQGSGGGAPSLNTGVLAGYNNTQRQQINAGASPALPAGAGANVSSGTDLHTHYHAVDTHSHPFEVPSSGIAGTSSTAALPYLALNYIIFANA